MSRIKIIRPEATVNLCTNPSAEKATTGWASSGLATFERSTTWQARGAWSIRGVANSIGDKIQAPTFAVTNGVTYTVSAKINILSGSWRTVVGGNNGAALGVGEHEVVVTYAADATTPDRLELECLSAAGEAFVDAVQYEQKAYATTYIDGDQDGGKWTAAAHASTSSRPVTSRRGGVVKDISTDYDVTYRTVSGVGMPQLRHLVQPLAHQDGGSFQGVRADPVLISLGSFIAAEPATGLEGLHDLRRDLIDLIKPDLVPGSQPLTLIYEGSGTAYEIDVHYVAGLEHNTQAPANLEDFSLQFISYDPRWRSPYDVGKSLAVSTAIANANYIVARIDGIWQALSTGANGTIQEVLYASDGKIYAVGAFTTIGGVAAARIAYWDPATGAWNAMGTGLNVDAYAVKEAPDGKIWVGGGFTTAGGVAANRIATWDPATSTWAAVGSGFGDNYVLAITFGHNGWVYAGGSFTNSGGASRLGIAIWTGATWATAGGAVDFLPTGAGSGVFTLATAPNGNIYAGMYQVTVGGSTFVDGAMFNPTTGLWSALGPQVTGVSGGFMASAVGPDGATYLGGLFLSKFIKKWNGFQYSDLGSGLSSAVQDMEFHPDGDLWVVGDFLAAGDLIFSDRLAKWDGAAWKPVPLDLPGAATINSVSINQAGNVVLGGAFTGSANAPGRTTVTNPGSSEAYPIIRVTGPGTVYHLENLTTGQEIIFNSLELMTGEVLTLDLRPGKVSVRTTHRGNAINKILGGSSLSNFVLAPGVNDIGLLIVSAGAPTAELFFRPRNWGAE